MPSSPGNDGDPAVQPQGNLKEMGNMDFFSGDYIQREGQKTPLVKAMGSQVGFALSECRSELLPGK